MPPREKNTCSLVQGLCELVNWRGDLQALLQNSPLALDTDVPRPAHETAQVAGRLDVLTCNGKHSVSMFDKLSVSWSKSHTNTNQFRSS